TTFFHCSTGNRPRFHIPDLSKKELLICHIDDIGAIRRHGDDGPSWIRETLILRKYKRKPHDVGRLCWLQFSNDDGGDSGDQKGDGDRNNPFPQSWAPNGTDRRELQPVRIRDDRFNLKAHVPNGVPALLPILA